MEYRRGDERHSELTCMITSFGWMDEDEEKHGGDDGEDEEEDEEGIILKNEERCKWEIKQLWHHHGETNTSAVDTWYANKAAVI